MRARVVGIKFWWCWQFSIPIRINRYKHLLCGVNIFKNISFLIPSPCCCFDFISVKCAIIIIQHFNICICMVLHLFHLVNFSNFAHHFDNSIIRIAHNVVFYFVAKDRIWRIRMQINSLTFCNKHFFKRLNCLSRCQHVFKNQPATQSHPCTIE